MKNFRNFILSAALLSVSLNVIAQDDTDAQDDIDDSVIRNLTPSKLISKGQFDIKWFNNIFTSTTFVDEDGDDFGIPRETFFTSTLEAFYGISENKKFNVGLILEARSNTIGGRGALEFLEFSGDDGFARSGLTSIAPSVKISPFNNLSLSVQSSIFIPLVGSETDNSVFLDQDGFTWQNRFFYDYILPGGDFQLFFELNTEYHFGETLVGETDPVTQRFTAIEGSFANDSFSLFPGVFFSYFPSSKFTVLVLTQHFNRFDFGDSIEQNFTASGAGVKYQLTKELNIEGLYTNFWRGNNNNTGQTFNLGLRLVL